MTQAEMYNYEQALRYKHGVEKAEAEERIAYIKSGAAKIDSIRKCILIISSLLLIIYSLKKLFNSKIFKLWKSRKEAELEKDIAREEYLARNFSN